MTLRTFAVTSLVIACILVTTAAPLRALADDSPAEVVVTVSPDSIETLITLRELGLTIYFGNDVSRLCITYQIPGLWYAGPEPGMVQSADGSTRVGVLTFSEADLAEVEGGDLIERAAASTAKGYGSLDGVKIEKTELKSFKCKRAGVKKWVMKGTVEWKGERRRMDAMKLFCEITPGWVAQVTANDEDLARAIIESIGTASAPDCYWPFMRENFPFAVPGAN